MEIFKELNNLGYNHYLPMTVEELDTLSIDSVEFSIEANLAFDWFRDKHKLFGLNSPLLNNEWTIVIDDVNTSHQIYWSKIIGYEEARLKCLEKLIELCKKN